MPRAVASVTWSGVTGSRVSNGTTVVDTMGRKYQVIDAENLQAAYNAIGMPQINAEWEPGSPYRMRGITGVNPIGPTTYELTTTWAIPTNGDFTTPETDPLLRPKRLSWGTGLDMLPMSTDARGRVVRNSAGDVFDPLPQQPRVTETLTIKWYAPMYDRVKSRGIVNCVNSDTVVIGGTTYLPGEMLCRSWAPGAEYTTDTARIPMTAVFELQNDSRAKSGVSGEPFDVALPDVGRHGWYLDDLDGNKLKRGWFAETRTLPDIPRPVLVAVVTQPVLLNGLGQPLAPLKADGKTREPSTIMVTDDPNGTGRLYAPSPSPDRYQMQRGPGPKNDPNNEDHSVHETPDVIMWRFRAHKAIPFTGLL